MIKRLKALVNWLESRFPEKVTVTAENYADLREELSHTESEVTRWIAKAVDLQQRMVTLEAHAVHKEAVQDLITVVKALKDDVTALKANLGWQQPAKVNEEMRAMLNGEVI